MTTRQNSYAFAIVDGGLSRRIIHIMGKTSHIEDLVRAGIIYLEKIAMEFQADSSIVVFDRPDKDNLYYRHKLNTMGVDLSTRYKADRGDNDWARHVYWHIRDNYVGGYSIEGHEADDLIHHISTSMNYDRPVIVITGDTDMLHMVNEYTCHVALMKKSGDYDLYRNAEDVKGKMGVTPQLVPSLKAIVGDSDFEGVKGVGEKTAVKLLERYGSIERMENEIEKDTNFMVTKAGKPQKAKIAVIGGLDLIRLNIALAHPVPVLGQGVTVKVRRPYVSFDPKDLSVYGDDTLYLIGDGACTLTGQGGWACMMLYQGGFHLMSGKSQDTTNNNMELMAFVSPLEAVMDEKKPKVVDIYSDSEYLLRSLRLRASDIVEGVTPNSGTLKRLVSLKTMYNIRVNKVIGHHVYEGDDPKMKAIYAIHSLVDNEATKQSSP